MKHSAKITAAIITLFVIAQIIGVIVIKNNFVKDDTGKIEYNALPLNIERPNINPDWSWMYLATSIIVGTLGILVIIYFKWENIAKIWFIFSVFVTLFLVIGSFIDVYIAAIIAAIFAILKIYKTKIWINNLVEVIMYPGLAILIYSILNIYSVMILFTIIAIYDYVAVRKTKHMIKMADFFKGNKMFPGIIIPKNKNEFAILGGGDIAFPMLFNAVIVKMYGWQAGMISILPIALSLLFLFVISKKGTYYPAIPYLFAGCLISLGVMQIVA